MSSPGSSNLEALVGSTLMVGLPGPRLSGADIEFLEELAPAGIILFDRNLEHPLQIRELLADLRRRLPEDSWYAIDQEGGQVSRLARWIGPTASAIELVDRGPQVVRDFATATAVTLRELGFNMDFAPVVDLSPADSSNGIGGRAFGVQPAAVIPPAAAFLAGLQSHGIAGCLKHFPGLGDTTVDSHRTLPTVTRSREALCEDLEPYYRLANESVAVMVGHGHYTAYDLEPTPATLSPQLVETLLRKKCGFDGLIISDDMEMGAVAALDDEGHAAVRAIAAGCDLLLYCQQHERAISARDRLLRTANHDELFRGRLELAAGTVRRLAHRWPVGAVGISPPPEASALLRRFKDYRPRV